MTEVDTTIAELRSRIGALEVDRDYWRSQHDLVMQDWRSDMETWATARADSAAGDTACRAALAELLRFFDPTTGAVAGRLQKDFLSDVFAQAHRAYATSSGRNGGTS